MTTQERVKSATGPVLGDELVRATPQMWSPPASSEVLGSDSEDLIARARRMNSSSSTATVQRLTLLGVLLASMEHVAFEDVALLLKVRDKRLEKMMHGEESIPGSVEKQWNALAEVLENLHTVLKPEATETWLHTGIPAFDGRTPLYEIEHGRIERVLALVRSYRDPSFS